MCSGKALENAGDLHHHGDFNPEDYIGGKKQTPTLFFAEELTRFAEVGFEPWMNDHAIMIADLEIH